MPGEGGERAQLWGERGGHSWVLGAACWESPGEAGQWQHADFKTLQTLLLERALCHAVLQVGCACHPDHSKGQLFLDVCWVIPQYPEGAARLSTPFSWLPKTPNPGVHWVQAWSSLAHPHPPGCHPHLGALPGPASPFAPSCAVWITSYLAWFPCLPTPPLPLAPAPQEPTSSCLSLPPPQGLQPPARDHKTITPNQPLLEENELMFSGQLFKARGRLLPSLPELSSR